jgi:hypothetical protein
VTNGQEQREQERGRRPRPFRQQQPERTDWIRAKAPIRTRVFFSWRTKNPGK